MRFGHSLLGLIDGLAAAELRSRQGQIEKLLLEALARRGLWPPRNSAARDGDD